MAIADLDFSLITKRKRMMDSVGHYSRPDLLRLLLDQEAKTLISEIPPPKFMSNGFDSSIYTHADKQAIHE